MDTQTIISSTTNVEIVQQGFMDFISGNIAGVADACTDDVTWGSYDNPLAPYAGTFKGKEGVLNFFSLLAGSVDYTEFTPHEYYTDPSKEAVLVRGIQAGKVKLTGKTFSHEWLMEFRLRGGKIASFFAFVDSRDQTQAFTPNLN